MSQDPAVKAGFRFSLTAVEINNNCNHVKNLASHCHVSDSLGGYRTGSTGSELMPKLPPSNFDPKMVSMLRSVLDAAVDQIDVAKRTPATKAKMAERILRAASDGVTDNEVLTAIAIQDGKQPAD
jgi:hypothetical protein